MSDPKRRMEAAVSEAIRRYGEGMEESFPAEFEVTLGSENQFRARVRSLGAVNIVEVDGAVLAGIDRLWDQVWDSTVLIGDSGKRVPDDDGSTLTRDIMAHLSLTWLVLHELMHVRLGHLELIGTAELIETEETTGSAGAMRAALNGALTTAEHTLFRPCLELQADNEATEVMFGRYGESEWDRFRIEAAAIFVVMALMENADMANPIGKRIYPRVATRFFTLFAQLFQYWLYPGAELYAGDGESFVRAAREPTGEAFQRYMKHVLAFAIADAVQIASHAGAKGFLADLGGGGDLFKDIYDIQYADDLARADLKTAAAREWRELLPVNEKIMSIMGLRQ